MVCLATEPISPLWMIAPKPVGQHKLESMGKGEEGKKEEEGKEERGETGGGNLKVG